jgi:hypothetical protein
MVKDIFSMSKAEFTAKFKALHKKIKEENASFNLPTTGYSDMHKCVVNTYIDGRVEKVTIESQPSIHKSQIYPGY